MREQGCLRALLMSSPLSVPGFAPLLESSSQSFLYEIGSVLKKRQENSQG